jgi:hypothetical protein
MSPVRHFLGLATLLLLVSTSVAMAARIDPPSIALGRPTTSLVLARFKDVGPGDRLVFETERTLRSEAAVPALIDIAKPDLIEPPRVGERYVLAYTVVKSDALKRTVANTRGAVFLATPGLEPALWKASAEIEALVTWTIGDEPAAMRAALPRLLALLRSRDPRLQDFAAAELAYRPALLRTLDAGEQRRLRHFVARPGGPSAARARLLLAALQMPAHGRSQTSWDDEATRLLRAHRPADRIHTELVLDAFRFLESRDVALPSSVVQPWLASAEIALVEAALASLRRHAPDSERDALGRALQRADLPQATRAFLLTYRDRLDQRPPAS